MKRKPVTKEEYEKAKKEIEGFTFPDDLDLIHPPQPTKEEEIERLEKLVQIQYEQIQSLKQINNVLMGIKDKAEGL